MDYLIQFQLNIFTITILIVLLMIVKLKMSISSFGKQLLMTTIILSMISLIVEPLTWIFDGAQFTGAFLLEYLTNFILMLLAPVIAAAMLSYVDYFIFKDVKRVEKRLFYLQPATLTFLLLIVNIFYPIYFDVNANNIYVAGNVAWIHTIVIGLMYLYMLAFLIKNRRRTERFNLLIFIAFFSLPFVGMLIQYIDVRFQFDWSMIAVGILVVYVFLESTTTERDYLTELYNRQSYEKHVQHLINSERSFSVMLIDLDNFKDINDNYGHKKGDQILILFSRVLQEAFAPSKFVFRLAGDEFMVVLDQEFSIQDGIDKLKAIMKQSDDELVKTLEFCKGYCEFKKGMNLEDIYTKIDRLMYREKEIRDKAK